MWFKLSYISGEAIELTKVNEKIFVVYAQEHCSNENNYEQFKKFVIYIVQEIGNLLTGENFLVDEKEILLQQKTKVLFNLQFSDQTDWLNKVKELNNLVTCYVFITLDDCSDVIPDVIIDVIKGLPKERVCVATFDYYDNFSVFDDAEKFWVYENVADFWNYLIQQCRTEHNELYQKEVLENLKVLSRSIKQTWAF